MSRESSSSSPPTNSVFVAVALIAAAVLGYEVALTRVFAVLLRYQFAFLVISLALCGMGLGGLWAHKRRELDLSNTALFFGFSSSLTLLLILRGVFAVRPDQFWIAALLVLIPFIAGGAFLATAFSRYSEYGGQLYAYDLAGAALAAFTSVLIMQGLGAIDACIVFGAMGALAGVFVARRAAFPTIITAMLLALVPYNTHFHLWRVPPIPPMFITMGKVQASLADRGITQPLFTELGNPKATSKIVDTRWNAFARTDVVNDDAKSFPTVPPSYLLYTNGNVPTNMMKWDGHLWSIPSIVRDFSLSDWTFRSANLSGKDVLSIGPGGGLDALLALRYGAKNFDGAEINPSIIGIMNEPKYRAFNGGIYSRPEVHVRTAEGRAFVQEAVASGKRYRMLFSALTKTATAGQGTALLESFIYTSDALNDYMKALDENGQVALLGDSDPMLGRLFVTAMDHFMAQGMSQREAGSHIAAVYFPGGDPYVWSLLIRKVPFSSAQTLQMAQDAATRHIYTLWIPERPANLTIDNLQLQLLGSGVLSLDGYVASARIPRIVTGEDGKPFTLPGLDMAPCPDDRPFVLDMGTSAFSVFSASPSLSILLGLSVFATFGFAAFLLRSDQPGSDLRSVAYFLALGVGFMLVEIPLIQKLILPLGYPTLSLTVILFSLLLGGGAGAAFSQRFNGESLRAHAQKCALGVVAGAGFFAIISKVLSGAMLAMPLSMRCVLAGVLLLPLGFLMGTPFPSGMRLFTQRRPDIVPLIWALNGTASVAGSIAAAVLAKSFGFSIVLGIGAVIYLGAAALLVSKEQ